MKLGFFGGSFNPPTYAHLYIAKTILNNIDLNEFYFVPMGNSYKKANLLDENIRLDMLNLICKNEEKIKVSEIELNKKETIKTYQAFELIKNTYSNDDIFFVMGADNFEKLPQWENSEELIKKYKYIIIDRNNINLDSIINKNKQIRDNIQNFTILNIEDKYKKVSSSQVRKFFEEKDYENVKKYVPQSIFEYIVNNKIWN